MSRPSVFLVALIAACLVSVTIGDVLIGPQNNAAIAGTSLTISCSWSTIGTERPQFVEFATNPNGALISDGFELLPGHPNVARYSLTVNNATGLQQLTISLLTLADGGRYMCRDIGPGPAVFNAQIIVLAANSNFTTTLPANRIVLLGEYNTAECRATYGGAIAPYVSWTGSPPFQWVYTNSTTQSWAGMQFTAARSHDAGQFSCRTNFTASQFATADPTYATNVPSYSYTTGTGVVFVVWAPYNMTYYPVQPSYEIGQVLTCWGDGLPVISYTWTNMATLESFQSQTLTIVPNMVGQLPLRCQAVNSVGTSNLFTNITVNPITTPTIPTTAPPTTTVPAIANCDNLSGRWEHSRADGTTLALCLHYEMTVGTMFGLVVNKTTDSYQSECMGVANNPIWDEFAVSTLYAPRGVGAFAGECRKCYGVEYMFVNGVSRNSDDAFFCNQGSELIPSPTMTFRRVAITDPCPRTADAWQARMSKRRR